jgi:hypothetical protein
MSLIEFKLKHNHSILIGTFNRPCRPPNSSVDYFTRIEDAIGLAVDSGISDIIVTGDFNLNILQHSTAQTISNLFQQFSISQLIDEPTHFTETSSSVIDLLFTNRNEAIVLSGVGDQFLSTQELRLHCPIFAIFKFQKPLPGRYKRHIWRYNDGDYGGFPNKLSLFDWNLIKMKMLMNLLLI